MGVVMRPLNRATLHVSGVFVVVRVNEVVIIIVFVSSYVGCWIVGGGKMGTDNSGGWWCGMMMVGSGTTTVWCGVTFVPNLLLLFFTQSICARIRRRSLSCVM